MEERRAGSERLRKSEGRRRRGGWRAGRVGERTEMWPRSRWGRDGRAGSLVVVARRRKGRGTGNRKHAAFRQHPPDPLMAILAADGRFGALEKRPETYTAPEWLRALGTEIVSITTALRTRSPSLPTPPAPCRSPEGMPCQCCHASRPVALRPCGRHYKTPEPNPNKRVAQLETTCIHYYESKPYQCPNPSSTAKHKVRNPNARAQNASNHVQINK